MLKIGKIVPNGTWFTKFGKVARKYEVKGTPEELADYNEFKSLNGWLPDSTFISINGPVEEDTVLSVNFDGTKYVPQYSERQLLVIENERKLIVETARQRVIREFGTEAKRSILNVVKINSETPES